LVNLEQQCWDRHLSRPLRREYKPGAGSCSRGNHDCVQVFARTSCPVSFSSSQPRNHSLPTTPLSYKLPSSQTIDSLPAVPAIIGPCAQPRPPFADRLLWYISHPATRIRDHSTTSNLAGTRPVRTSSEKQTVKRCAVASRSFRLSCVQHRTGLFGTSGTHPYQLQHNPTQSN
jgi:hypothetical protein